MSRSLPGLLAAAALSAGCAVGGEAGGGQAGGAPTRPAAAPAQTAPPPTVRSPTAPAGAVLPPVTDLRVALDHEQAPAAGPAGAGQLSWRSTWRLTWAPVVGATGYAVHYRTNEGAALDGEPDEVLAEPSLTVEVAAGTSPPARLEQDRRAGALFTSSQLLAAVRPLGPSGSGASSPWFPVGDVPADGRPLPAAGTAHGHGPGG